MSEAKPVRRRRKPKPPDADTLSRILRAYQEVARDEIVKDFGRASCIAATRITIDVLRQYKVEAVAMSVTMIVANAIHVERLTAGEVPPADPQALQEWFERTGAWAVSIGDVARERIKRRIDGQEAEAILGIKEPSLIVGSTPTDDLEIGDIVLVKDQGYRVQEGPGGIPMLFPIHVGHVVAYLPHHNVLVDAAANQINRPEKQIELPGVLLIRVPDSVSDNIDCGVYGQYRGCRVFYKRSNNDTYRDGEIWFDSRKTKYTREAILTAMAVKLATGENYE